MLLVCLGVYSFIFLVQGLFSIHYFQVFKIISALCWAVINYHYFSFFITIFYIDDQSEINQFWIELVKLTLYTDYHIAFITWLLLTATIEVKLRHQIMDVTETLVEWQTSYFIFISYKYSEHHLWELFTAEVIILLISCTHLDNKKYIIKNLLIKLILWALAKFFGIPWSFSEFAGLLIWFISNPFFVLIVLSFYWWFLALIIMGFCYIHEENKYLAPKNHKELVFNLIVCTGLFSLLICGTVLFEMVIGYYFGLFVTILYYVTKVAYVAPFPVFLYQYNNYLKNENYNTWPPGFFINWAVIYTQTVVLIYAIF